MKKYFLFLLMSIFFLVSNSFAQNPLANVQKKNGGFTIEDDGYTFTWSDKYRNYLDFYDAEQWTKDLQYRGVGGWRLPSREEVIAIRKYIYDKFDDKEKFKNYVRGTFTFVWVNETCASGRHLMYSMANNNFQCYENSSKIVTTIAVKSQD